MKIILYNIIVLVAVLIVFGLMANVYFKTLLWIHDRISYAPLKWSAAAVVYIGFAAAFVVIPMIFLVVLDLIMLDPPGMVWTFILALLVEFAATLRFSKRYKDQMKQAGYWK